jgi:hypothetical protein
LSKGKAGAFPNSPEVIEWMFRRRLPIFKVDAVLQELVDLVFLRPISGVAGSNHSGLQTLP